MEDDINGGDGGGLSVISEETYTKGRPDQGQNQWLIPTEQNYVKKLTTQKTEGRHTRTEEGRSSNTQGS
jgi:hypothetical protein